jgi:RNA polymerase sigma factor (sigma-70 family)
MTVRQYNECVDLYADGLYRFVLKNLRQGEDARDVVQSSFEKLWMHHGTVDPAKAKSYLFTIAYHQTVDHIRRERRARLVEKDPEPVVMNRSSQPDVTRILDEALSRLNHTQRNLVLLKDYEGYSYQEIGEITGLNATQVKVYLHRARMTLREYLVKPENIV